MYDWPIPGCETMAPAMLSGLALKSKGLALFHLFYYRMSSLVIIEHHCVREKFL